MITNQFGPKPEMPHGNPIYAHHRSSGVPVSGGWVCSEILECCRRTWGYFLPEGVSSGKELLRPLKAEKVSDNPGKPFALAIGVPSEKELATLRTLEDWDRYFENA